MGETGVECGWCGCHLIRLKPMTYQVLARKWRPRDFASFVGQEHVVRALSNALTQQRLHHAYLFTGTRGVGKTTLARILAKCLNCETGITASPCGTCSACQSIDAGRFIDLLEVDAASRTKVEDTRELLENVQYAPTQGRYKVYLIDEVHMLSGHSFNALLKTLEEPPPHVKFLLATTDPQKLPITVLSRCLQFHLKNMPPEQISQHLATVLTQEKISFETEAAAALARAANGSMRDALSLLDQAIAYGNGQLLLSEVQAMLGSIPQTQLFDLVNHLADQAAAGLLAIVDQLSEQAADFAQVLEELLALLHQLAIVQVIPAAYAEPLTTLAKRFTAEQLQLYYQIALTGRRDLPYAPTPQIGFSMTLLRMVAFRPAELPLPMASASVNKTANAPTQAPKATVTHSAPVPAAAAGNENWENILVKLSLTGFTKALASHCTLGSTTDTSITLILDPNQAPMLNEAHKQRLTAALSDYFQRPMQVIIQIGNSSSATTPAALQKQQQVVQQAAAEQALTQDPQVSALMKTFNGIIVADSIKPISSD